MFGVVEWIAPVRNSAWVAACFGTVDPGPGTVDQ